MQFGGRAEKSATNAGGAVDLYADVKMYFSSIMILNIATVPPYNHFIQLPYGNPVARQGSIWARVIVRVR
jgi:hypothetical protein